MQHAAVREGNAAEPHPAAPQVARNSTQHTKPFWLHGIVPLLPYDNKVNPPSPIRPFDCCDGVRRWNQPASFQLWPQRARARPSSCRQVAHMCAVLLLLYSIITQHRQIPKPLLQPVATTAHAKRPQACLPLRDQPRLTTTNTWLPAGLLRPAATTA